jgi:mannose-6-phosphate isomerase-like protein (cupin superfamily)
MKLIRRDSKNQEFIEKPWGFEIIWAKTDKYVGKLLQIDAGKQLSRQYHETKDETIFVLEGTLNLEIGENKKIKKLKLKPGYSYHITPGVIHRFCTGEALDGGPGSRVRLMEVSTTELDDVVRVEDDYGRAKEKKKPKPKRRKKKTTGK